MSERDHPDEGEYLPPGVRKIQSAARRTDRSERLLSAMRFMRQVLPGDSDLGDPLSTAGSDPSHLLARRVSEAAERHPSAARELGLGALQVWQALSEKQGRGLGDIEVAILFTDLVDFSNWALESGDTAVLGLLREMGRAVEPIVRDHGGEVVKRLGDGMMAVFPDARSAVDAAVESCRAVGELDIGGHRPELRAGIHYGRPRKIGGDYLGVDVNVAARVMADASEGEVRVSETAAAQLPEGAYQLKPQRRFRAKGAPKDLRVFTVRTA